MGKLRGFIEIDRLKPSARASRRAPARLARVRAAVARGQAARPGRALHGLRHPVLPRRLSARKPHPRLQRSRVRRPLGRGVALAARDQQLPRDHRAGLPGAVRGVVRAQPREAAGHDQGDRKEHHRSRVRRRRAAGRCARRSRAASASPSSARGPRGWRRRRSWRARDTTSSVLEKADRIGGLLRYGIPDFKLEKDVLDRRLEQMRAEGVDFRTGVDCGSDVSGEELRASYDAVVLAGGAMKPRDLDGSRPRARGVHFAMDFLTQQNRRVAGAATSTETDIVAERQARGRPRRRRHRLRLRRHVAAPGRRVACCRSS